MVNYKEAKVNLTKAQLRKLKSAAKKKKNAGKKLRTTKKNFSDEKLPHELFLTTRPICQQYVNRYKTQ